MVLTWGKPKLEIAPYVNGALPETPIWTVLPTPKEETTKLNTEKGTKKEAIAEGGGIVDTYYQKSKYSLEFTLFKTASFVKPIDDVDGVITTNCAIRLTPEDDSLKGFIIDKAAVSVVESWSSSEGSMLTYTFDGLEPDTGTIIKEYEA